ncbi:hypothetical protein LSM04_009720 [Trypanosoma melophagium]|uniref:uncharacterized protein n=1 Tax=Trypanosoma melophagium TaxID=715481 RepID=UPI003519EEC3|nr:hypothetical protein LSM04_009720 [Trypanosoma melophagium]
MMIENNKHAQMLRRLALSLFRVNLTLVAFYVRYIIAYFVSSDEEWLLRSPNVNTELKEFVTLASLDPLLPVEQVALLASLKESMSRLCTFVCQHGPHVASAPLLSPEFLAAAMGRCHRDGPAEMFPAAVSPSPSVRR